MKEKSKNWHKNLSKEEEYKIKEYQKTPDTAINSVQQKSFNKQINFVLPTIKMSKNMLKFYNIKIKKKKRIS